MTGNLTLNGDTTGLLNIDEWLLCTLKGGKIPKEICLHQRQKF